MNFDKAFLISLPDYHRRRNNFKKMAVKAGVEYEWFPGINGKEADLSYYSNNGYLASDFKMRMPGSLGCLLSHVSVWEKIVEESECDIGLIFEEDAVIGRNFIKLLDEISWSKVPDDWDMIWLGWHKINCRPLNDKIGVPIKFKKGVNSGHFCYLIRSESVEKIKSILLPYNNKNSKDVILRQSFNRFNAYFLLDRIARTPYFFNESSRKVINSGSVLKRRMKSMRKLFKKSFSL